MNGSFFEMLESRRLLSATALLGPVGTGWVSTDPSEPATPAPSTTALAGVPVHAEAGQSFQAVIGRMQNFNSLPPLYALRGEINWGDGSAASLATFVRQSDGSVAVLGSHTYANVGAYAIKVAVVAEPPPGTTIAVRVIGTFQSKADVISSPGGVTLEETAGRAFTARVGLFHSTAPASTMIAVINWGDGTSSRGTIEVLPTASAVPTYAVVGSHTYANIGSHVAHVTVYAVSPTPIASTTDPTTTPTVIAKIDSVVDVLPPLTPSA